MYYVYIISIYLIIAKFSSGELGIGVIDNGH